MACGLAALTAVPAAAGDRFPTAGPLEIRIFGANGAVRDFVARAAPDRRGAIALVSQLDGAIEGPPQAIEESAVMLPHYRIDVSRLGQAYVTAPWERVLETTFIYFPGGQENSFMVVEFSRGHVGLEQRWILPEPDVAALLDRHLKGLAPIGLGPPLRAAASAPWNLGLGGVMLAAVGLAARRKERWKRGRNQRSATSGTLPAA